MTIVLRSSRNGLCSSVLAFFFFIFVFLPNSDLWESGNFAANFFIYFYYIHLNLEVRIWVEHIELKWAGPKY